LPERAQQCRKLTEKFGLDRGWDHKGENKRKQRLP
jgi:hypothetical protein